jgi:hypothetical protein
LYNSYLFKVIVPGADMANPQHLKILSRGVKEWNRWKARTKYVQADLSGADLRGWPLCDGINEGIEDEREKPVGINFRNTNLTGAKLDNAILSFGNLTGANLHRCSLRKVFLDRAVIHRCILTHADLSRSFMGGTVLTGTDLSTTIGLDTVRHAGPSSIGLDTIYLSQGNVPEKFLRGAGVPEVFVEYMPSLVLKPIVYYSCFISYSSHDDELAERLYSDLQAAGVRCWFAPHDLLPGQVIIKGIDEAIRVHEKVLLLLSKSSVESNWVEHEVELALTREVHTDHPVLFPVRLDDAIFETTEGWAVTLRESRHIGDFRDWKNYDSYKQALQRLLRDLGKPK